jgi:hypothetical protein
MIHGRWRRTSGASIAMPANSIITALRRVKTLLKRIGIDEFRRLFDQV